MKSSIFKIIIYPIVLFKRCCVGKYIKYLESHNLKKLASLKYFLTFKKRINWKNPQNLSEKINWMKFNTDTSLWTQLADKYAVRAYVKEKGLEHILVKLYGVWDNPEDIDFNQLPDSFVLKSNHGCGTVLIVKDKTRIKIEQTRALLKDWLKMKFGTATAEPHYLSIKPLIIAEEYLCPQSGDIVDYKLFVVNGLTELVMVCCNRQIGKGSQISLYDSDWNYSPERLGECHAYDNVPIMPKPKTLEKMKEYATILAKDIPFVRIDFYDIDGKLYFGEMTFTPKGGYCSTLTEKESLRIGNKIVLPHKTNL